jgi:ferredoxin
MTIHSPISPAASVVILLIVALATACSDTNYQNTPTSVPPITATPGTALYHAQICQQQLGQIPTWACQDGVQIPVTVNGTPVTTTPDKCDNPDLKGECFVGSYAGHIAGMNFDGSPKPEVNWVYFCRRDDNFAQMIGYDKNSGASCFFELQDGFMPLEQGVPKGAVPGVDDPAYESAWKRPESIAVQACNTCHSPDPFIHTPYIDAARQPDDSMKPIVPKLATPTSPYFVVGEAFAGWTFDYVEFDNNACTSCHRLPDFRRFTFGSGVDFNAHMPPLAPGSMKADFDAVMACLNEGPDKALGCRWAALNGATPAKDPVVKTTDGNGSFITTYGTLNAVDPFAAGSGTFSGTDISPVKVGAIAGAASGQVGMVQLEILGHQEIAGSPAGIDYVARFFVPIAEFTTGKVLDDTAMSGELLLAIPDQGTSFPIGKLVKGTISLTKAGAQPSDPVEGTFSGTWQDAK